MNRPVAVLCCSGRSIYKHRPEVLAYDSQRDARTFPGGVPVIAHPPCRCWSKYLRHQAKPQDREAEMDLGKWCVDQVIRHGGILEHPHGSKLWDACNLPKPGDWQDPFLYTVFIEQRWFGFPARKRTWVLVSGVPKPSIPAIPFRFEDPDTAGGMAYRELSSRTMPALADWFLSLARATWHSLPVLGFGNRCQTGGRFGTEGLASVPKPTAFAGSVLPPSQLSRPIIKAAHIESQPLRICV